MLIRRNPPGAAAQARYGVNAAAAANEKAPVNAARRDKPEWSD